MNEDDDNPCIGVCIIGDDGICEGCGRTEAEIRGETPDPKSEKAE